MSSYVDNMFRAQAAAGGVVRRNIGDVYRLGVLEEIVDVAREEGWHVIETGDQIVVLCHTGRLSIIC